MSKEEILFLLDFISAYLGDEKAAIVLCVYTQDGAHFASNTERSLAQELLSATVASFDQPKETIQ
jgi:hypothetical protein